MSNVTRYERNQAAKIIIEQLARRVVNQLEDETIAKLLQAKDVKDEAMYQYNQTINQILSTIR